LLLLLRGNFFTSKKMVKEDDEHFTFLYSANMSSRTRFGQAGIHALHAVAHDVHLIVTLACVRLGSNSARKCKWEITRDLRSERAAYEFSFVYFPLFAIFMMASVDGAARFVGKSASQLFKMCISLSLLSILASHSPRWRRRPP